MDDKGRLYRREQPKDAQDYGESVEFVTSEGGEKMDDDGRPKRIGYRCTRRKVNLSGNDD
jgi:hypothetical protein